MNKSLVLIGLVGLAALTACSKKAEEQQPGATESASPSVTRESIVPVPVPVTDPAERARIAQEQAATLAGNIDSRPECEPFRKQFEDASKAPAGSPESQIDLTGVMAQAVAANCDRKPVATQP